MPGRLTEILELQVIRLHLRRTCVLRNGVQARKQRVESGKTNLGLGFSALLVRLLGLQYARKVRHEPFEGAFVDIK